MDEADGHHCDLCKVQYASKAVSSYTKTLSYWNKI